MLFDTAIDSFHRAGDEASLATTFVSLAVFFDRIGRHETAATMYGASTQVTTTAVGQGPSSIACGTSSATLGSAAASRPAPPWSRRRPLRYARHQIDLARFESADRAGTTPSPIGS